jgi:hypothetical protein
VRDGLPGQVPLHGQNLLAGKPDKRDYPAASGNPAPEGGLKTAGKPGMQKSIFRRLLVKAKLPQNRLKLPLITLKLPKSAESTLVGGRFNPLFIQFSKDFGLQTTSFTVK